jgi:hypothetical protein
MSNIWSSDVSRQKFDYSVFMVVRLFSVAVRPLALMVLLNSGYTAEADNLGLVILSISSFLVFYGIPAHLDFYKHYFSQDFKSKKLESSDALIYKYITGIVGHALIISPIVFSLFIFRNYTLFLAALLVAILIVEKYFDEVLRFQLFTKQYIAWAIITAIKFTIPLTLYGFHIWLAEITVESTFATYNAGVLLVMLCVSALYQYRYGLKKVLGYISLRRVVKDTYGFWKSKLVPFVYLAVTPVVMTLDKWYVSYQNVTGDLSSLLIISQVGSIVFMLSSMLFVQNRRARLTIAGLGLDELFLGIRIPITVTLVYVILNMLLFIFPGLYGGTDPKDSINLILVVVGYFCLYAIGEPLFENIFWNVSSLKLLVTDGIILIFCAVLGYLQFMYSSLTSISWLILIFLLVKVIVYLIFLLRSPIDSEIIAVK